MLYIFLEFNVVRIFDNFSQTYDIKTQSDIFWTEEVSFNLLSPINLTLIPLALPTFKQSRI
jgi:hypothetical protein